MSYKLKTQRIAEERQRNQNMQAWESRLSALCIDFGQFLLDKLQENGILAERIEVTEEDVRQFSQRTADGLSTRRTE